MRYRRLAIYFEGKNDTLFYENVIKPNFANKYDNVSTWEYAPREKKEMKRFYRSIKAMDSDFLFVADLNGNPCVGKRIEKLIEKYPFLRDENIQVVVTVIEGWYLAGLNDEGCRELRIKCLKTTDKVSEGHFEDIRKTTKMKDIIFRTEILDLFDVETARTKNKSFAYFYEKYLKENNNN